MAADVEKNDEVGELVDLHIRGVDLVDTPAIGQPWYVVKRHNGGAHMSKLDERMPDQAAITRAVGTLGRGLSTIVRDGSLPQGEAEEITKALDMVVDQPTLDADTMKSVQGALDTLETLKQDMPKNVQAAFKVLSNAVKGARTRGDMGSAEVERDADATQAKEEAEKAAKKKPDGGDGEPDEDDMSKGATTGDGPEAGSTAGESYTATREQRGSSAGDAYVAARSEAGAPGAKKQAQRLAADGITKAFDGQMHFSALTDALTDTTAAILKAHEGDRAELADAALDAFAKGWTALFDSAASAFTPEVDAAGELTASAQKAYGAVAKMAGLTKADEARASQAEAVLAGIAEIEGAVEKMRQSSGGGGGGFGKGKTGPATLGGGPRTHSAPNRGGRVFTKAAGDDADQDEGDDKGGEDGAQETTKSLTLTPEVAQELLDYIDRGIENVTKALEAPEPGQRVNGHEAAADEGDGFVSIDMLKRMVDERVDGAIREARKPIFKSHGGEDGETVRRGAGGSDLRKRIDEIPDARERRDVMNQVLLRQEGYTR